MICLVLLATLAFCLSEAHPGGTYGAHGGYANAYHGNRGGYGHYAKAAPNNGYEADVNKNNAARQLGVNTRAQYAGSGTGTARKDGVPGTPLGRTGYDKYSYGHGKGYGNAYGNGYGNNYGNQYAQGHGYVGGAVHNGYGHGKQAAYVHGHANHGYAGY